MSLRKYLMSSVFFKQAAIAVIIVVAILFLFLQWIGFSTNHGQEIVVPNLLKLSVDAAEEKLDELDLEYVLLDTIDYDASFPKFAVVKQDPNPGEKVKEGRKIYIKINAGSHQLVAIPNLIEQTLRQAEPSLKALGLQIGQIKYVPYIGKDMVLKLFVNGRVLKAGEKLPKLTTIDLEVGDGNEQFNEDELVPAADTIATPLIDE